MAIPVGNSVALSGNPLIDGLVQGGSWQFTSPAHVLTYSLTLNDGPTDPLWNQYPDVQLAVVQALQAWANVANISFQEVDSGILFSQSSADMALMLTADPAAPLAGIGLFPDPHFVDTFLAADGQYTRVTYPNPEGDVVYNVGLPAMGQMNEGSYGYEVVLHEIGHALGLKHPDDDGGNGRPTFSQLGISSLDSTNETVMSNNDPSGQSGSSGHSTTPMPLDILAIQQIYGANMSYHTGDDVYTFPSNGAPSTIWDAGGVDSIDASSALFPVTIDLHAGNFSTDTGFNGSKLAIAYGVTIENAIGGLGNDTIIGNDADNTLDGGGGADQLSGGKGNDTYNVDSPGDVATENAGEGTDLVNSLLSYTLPANVENLTLTGTANLTGTGNGLDNVITGNAGDNTLTGGAGIDVLDGGAGIDTMSGGAGNDTYVVSEQFSPTNVVLAGDTWQAGTTLGTPLAFDSVLTNATVRISATDSVADPDTLVDSIEVSFISPTSGAIMVEVDLQSALGQTLQPGTYTNAIFFHDFSNPALALIIDGQGRGGVTPGDFTITDIQIDYSTPSPTLQNLHATFDYRFGTSTVTGTVNVNEPGQGPADVVTEQASEGVDSTLR